MESTPTPTNSNITTTPFDNDKLVLLKGQIEYYMSDENLKGDKFFHEKISSDSEGYVDIVNFLACNKVKKSGATSEDILKAVSTSTLLQVSGDRVRRVDNKALPELKLLNKKTKREDTEGDGEGEKQTKQDRNDREQEESFDPVILEIKADKEPEFKWKQIQDKFKALHPLLKTVYLRFNKDSGHIGVYNSQPELEFRSTFEIDGVNFTITKCEGDALIDFWKDHGGHFELCIGRNKDFDKRKKGGHKGGKDFSALRNPVTIGDETFTDVSRIKSRARRILTSTKDGEKIPGGDHDFLLDLLKFHRNFDEKTKNISHFTAGKPTEHNYSRCFFIVSEGDKKEDFSIHKCIEQVTNQNKKKK
jgi:hypothetical protein